MRFTSSHEWILVTEEIGVVGITSYAQQELGEIVHVALPTVGAHAAFGKEIAVIESTKAAVDIYSPVSGEIVAVNEELYRAPGLLNQFPEDLGWLFKIRLTLPSELEQLMDREHYLEMMES